MRFAGDSVESWPRFWGGFVRFSRSLWNFLFEVARAGWEVSLVIVIEGGTWSCAEVAVDCNASDVAVVLVTAAAGAVS